jgi:hypothetical protein
LWKAYLTRQKFRPTVIEFDTDIPDDCLWDEDGERVIRPGGMVLSETLAALLKEGDARVSDPEMDEEHESWDFDVDWRGEYFRVQVIHMNTCLVVVHGGPSLLARLIFWKAPRQADLAEHIWAILAADQRFSAIRPY